MFCRNKQLIIAALIGVGFSGSVLAESAAERVRQINEDIAVLSAQLQKLELEAKIAGKEAEKQRSEGTGTKAGFLGQPLDEMPVVRAIDGMDGKLVATLAMRGGMVQTVRQGEKFGAWTTNAITVNAVTLARGKEIVRLPFGNEPPSAINPFGQPSGIGGPMGIGGGMQALGFGQ